jgi:hypothetical protein
MAAPGPATITPQADRRGWSLAWSTAPRPGRCGCAAWRHTGLLVGPPAGALQAGRQPIHAHRLADLGHLRQPFPLLEGGHERPIGLAQPQRGQLAQLAQQQVQAIADLGLADPDRPGGTPVGQPVQHHRTQGVQPDLQRQRRVPPWPPRRAGHRCARRSASQRSTSTGRDERGRYDNGDWTSWKGENPPMVRSPPIARIRHHGHPQSPTGRLAPMEVLRQFRPGQWGGHAGGGMEGRHPTDHRQHPQRPDAVLCRGLVTSTTPARRTCRGTATPPTTHPPSPPAGAPLSRTSGCRGCGMRPRCSAPPSAANSCHANQGS